MNESLNEKFKDLTTEEKVTLIFGMVGAILGKVFNLSDAEVNYGIEQSIKKIREKSEK